MPGAKHLQLWRQAHAPSIRHMSPYQQSGGCPISPSSGDYRGIWHFLQPCDAPRLAQAACVTCLMPMAILGFCSCLLHTKHQDFQQDLPWLWLLNAPASHHAIQKTYRSHSSL